MRAVPMRLHTRRNMMCAALLGLLVFIGGGCSSGESGIGDDATVVPAEAASVAAAGQRAEPIVSTGADQSRDLLKPRDPSAFACVVELGQTLGEFYDKAADELLFVDGTYFFEARYTDGATVEIRVHPELVGTATGDALAQAERIAQPIGLLPVELRAGIERVGFLDGDSTAQADGGGEGIHLYERNVALRESTNRLEETLFHESVHTSIDDIYGTSAQWQAAQSADAVFLTEYAGQQPEREDLAETALYAWALSHHRDRVSDADAAAWLSAVPERIAFIDSVLSGPGQGFSTVDVSC